MEDMAKIREILKPAPKHPRPTRTARQEQSRPVKAKLEIEPPLAVCGHCRFTSALSGEWSVEGGQLVWRTDADFQPCRGPDLLGCCETSPVAKFTAVEVIQTSHNRWDHVGLSEDDFITLRTAQLNAEAQ